jgi:hypothetical protein
VNIHRWNAKKRDYAPLGQLPVAMFNQIHVTRKLLTETLIGLDATNMDQLVQIKDEPNDDRKRLLALKEIEKAIDEIRSKFLETKYQPLLQMLLTDFYEHRSGENILGILAKEATPILEMIKAVSQRYESELQMKRSKEELLKQLIFDANYFNLVNVQGNIVIARTMGLLEQAFTHIANMKDQNVVFVMGNTGAGKSTAISYLLGADLEEFSNRVGEQVVKVKGNSQGFPIIGQSIGTSETIYTQGYRLNDAHLMFGDCPGFNDTRGGDYELCTNISIEQSVLGAGSIPALVLVVPVAAITVDRGNPVVNLIHLVQERFPSTFNPDEPENNQRVFILFSKQNQVRNEVLQKLKDGTRFNELINEANQKINEMRGRGVEPDNFEIQQIIQRRKVWAALAQMIKNKQIDFIDTENEAARDRLIKKYRETTHPIKKDQYVSVMSGKYMQEKFGSTVQQAAYSWHDRILGEYFVQVPKAIEGKETEIEKMKAKIQSLATKKENQLKKNEERKNQIDELTKYISDLRAYQANPTDDAMRQQLLQKGSKHANRSLEIEQSRLDDINFAIEINNISLLGIQTDIQEVNQNIEESTNKISNMTREIAKKSDGIWTDPLHTKNYQSEDDLHMKVWRPGAREIAYQRGFELDSDYDPSKAYSIKAKDYRGETVSNAYIERGYRLVPADPAQYANFIGANREGGGYIAKVDGLKYLIDLACKPVDQTGQKVSYGYKLIWDGGELPRISITHTMPNALRYEARINELNSQIFVHNQYLNDFKLHRDGDGTPNRRGLVGDKAALEAASAKLEQEKMRQIEKIKEIKHHQVLEQVKDLIATTNIELENAKNAYQQLLNTQELDDELARLSGEQTALEQIILNLKLKLQNLEIIIVTQWDSAKLLRDFAELITQKAETNTDTGVIPTCRAFMRIFDERKDAVEKLINKQKP